MSNMVHFALNQMVAPRLSVRSFIDLAAKLDCIGVELRNDLRAKGVSEFDFLDGESPETISAYAADKNIRIIGLSEVYGFNYWTDTIHAEIETLIHIAKKGNAETISLIPDNGGAIKDIEQRMEQLSLALEKIKPMLSGTDIIALIEPLGFSTSTLQLKREAKMAFETVDGQENFRLVHDSFHHYLSQEEDIFPAQTGIVHISGIKESRIPSALLRDDHRVLVDADDRLHNITQINALRDAGYQGAFSFEPFSPIVHETPDFERALANSMEYIRSML